MAPLCLTCGSRRPGATSASLPENRLSAYLLLSPLPHPVQGLPPSFIYGLSLAASSTPSAHPGCPPEVWAQLGTLDWQVQHLPESMYMWWVKGGWVCSARLGPAQLVRWQGHGPILPISAPSGPLEVPEYRQRLNTTKTSHSVPQGREGLLKTQI